MWSSCRASGSMWIVKCIIKWLECANQKLGFIVRSHFIGISSSHSFAWFVASHVKMHVIYCRWLYQLPERESSPRRNMRKNTEIELWCFISFLVLDYNLWLSFARIVSTWAVFIAFWQRLNILWMHLMIWFFRISLTLSLSLLQCSSQWSAQG